jgi:hypothetical protein
VIKKPPPPSTFSVDGVVDIMDYGVGEEEKLIARGKVITWKKNNA